jgi:hypothetical protein
VLPPVGLRFDSRLLSPRSPRLLRASTDHATHGDETQTRRRICQPLHIRLAGAEQSNGNLRGVAPVGDGGVPSDRSFPMHCPPRALHETALVVIATSILASQWKSAEIYPRPNDPLLAVSEGESMSHAVDARRRSVFIPRL